MIKENANLVKKLLKNYFEVSPKDMKISIQSGCTLKSLYITFFTVVPADRYKAFLQEKLSSFHHIQIDYDLVIDEKIINFFGDIEYKEEKQDRYKQIDEMMGSSYFNYKGLSNNDKKSICYDIYTKVAKR